MYKLSGAIQDYIDSIRGQKSLSTVNIYDASLSKFLNFAGDINVEEIQEKTVNINFRKHLLEKLHLSEISAAYALQHIRYLLQYLKLKNYTSLDPNKTIDKELINKLVPNTRQYKGDIISEDEAELILSYWKNSSDFNNPRGIRNQLILSILWETGMTVSELEALTKDDISWTNSTLSLHYKDDKKQYKNRKMKVGADTMVWLKKYFNTRADDCQALIVAFNSWDPYIVHAWPLTARSIQRLILQTIKNLKINKKISPSVLGVPDTLNSLGRAYH